MTVEEVPLTCEGDTEGGWSSVGFVKIITDEILRGCSLSGFRPRPFNTTHQSCSLGWTETAIFSSLSKDEDVEVINVFRKLVMRSYTILTVSVA